MNLIFYICHVVKEVLLRAFPIDDEPNDTFDEEEEDQWYIYSQHCLGCYEDGIEIGYKPCTHAPYCRSCNKKWHDEAIRTGEIFTCILCQSAVEIMEDLRKD
ncbi:Protein of unknown function [Cotesia congregata]|uniref:RING-type domain-containing protein n=1 Tax=Cotesia congregata TaxID=51543 RepID=A0A8J2MI99_COTCN|nr:Protein of unknown function [Cotesia congregata]